MDNKIIEGGTPTDAGPGGEQVIYYPERLAPEQTDVHLDLTTTCLVVDIANVDVMPNEEYALARKNGLGTSDSSIVLGVNPYKNKAELIKDKTTLYLTEEDKEIGEKSAVKKGRDLEPLIIEKFQRAFKQHTWKPSDMYRHTEFDFLKFNYDGVTGTPAQYIPAEIKVVTTFGEKHYNKNKAMFCESKGFLPIQADITGSNNSILTKAAHYGIPPYYYTQLQQQILGLNAPFGYLSVLFEKSWEMHTFFVHRDDKLISQLITDGYKIWAQVEKIRSLNK